MKNVKNSGKNLGKYFIVLFLLFNSTAAFSDTRSDANKLLNYLEALFPELLSPTNTQYLSGLCLRHYPSEEIYTGVVCESGSGLPLNNGYALLGTELVELGQISQYSEGFASLSNADGNASDSAGNGSCVNIPFKAHEGKVQTIQVSTTIGADTVSFNTVNEYLTVTDTTSTTRVTISDISGLGDSSVSILTEHYQILDNFLFESSNESVITTTIFGIESTTTVTATMSPSYKVGPVNIFCEGQTWTGNSYTEATVRTLSTMGFTSELESFSAVNPGYSGIVSSINQSVTVPAGTFNTVQQDFTMTDGGSITQWYDTNTGALVKMEFSTISDGETATGVMEMLSLE